MGRGLDLFCRWFKTWCDVIGMGERILISNSKVLLLKDMTTRPHDCNEKVADIQSTPATRIHLIKAEKPMPRLKGDHGLEFWDLASCFFLTFKFSLASRVEPHGI